MRKKDEKTRAIDALELGDRIRNIRKGKNYSQEQLAGIIGGACTSKQVSAWEKGLHEPGAEKLFLIAEALGVTPTDLAPAGMFQDSETHKVAMLFDLLEQEEKAAIIQLIEVICRRLG